MNGSQAAESHNRHRTTMTTLRHLGTRLLIAVVVGCASYSVAFFLSDHVPFMRFLIEQASNQADDVRMLFYADYKAPAPGTAKMLFLDLDQKSYAQLGRPTVTPRKLLASMLEKVAEGKPKLIILDIDPTWPGDEDDTQRLADTLARLGHGPTPILLYRTPMAPAGKGDDTYFRPSPKLDPVVEGSHSLMWVSSGAVPSAERIVRSAPLWIRGCLGEKPLRLPGPALAGWIILKDQQPATVKERLTKALEETGRYCKANKTAAAPRTDSVTLTIGKQHYRLGNDWPTGTITYSMSPTLPLGYWHDPRALMVLSARPFIEASKDISAEIFHNRAVIIGSSAHDLRDFHLTPLGEMPGAMVIANQLRSLQEYGPGERPSLLFGLLMTVVLCVVTFLAWLGFRRIAPVAPCVIEQFYSMLICVFIWFILTLLTGVIAAPLNPLVQYLVILVLFALAYDRGSRHSEVHSENAR